jgi:hypothetical protein
MLASVCDAWMHTKRETYLLGADHGDGSNCRVFNLAALNLVIDEAERL